jgi:hypothetical protein
MAILKNRQLFVMFFVEEFCGEPNEIWLPGNWQNLTPVEPLIELAK